MPAAPEPKLDALIQDCSLQSAQACFRKLCPGGFKRQSEELENPNTDRFTRFTQFGELHLDDDTLFFAYAESENDLTERSARKAQFDAARDLLKVRGEYDAGIFIFRGPNGAFRLSFITKIYKGSKADFSHFRRYTYFVDPATDGNGTFIRQIGGCSFDSLDAIQEAFSVEAINKDFYKELANWYFWAMKHVHFPTDDVALDKKDLLADKQKVREHDAKNLIRLLTRMLFVWFIKQRGLVPHDLFNTEAIARDYLEGFSADYLDGFDATSSDSRYYKAILQNFFFAALNQERGKREFRKMGAAHRDNMCLMRYKDAFKNPQRFLDTVEATTPFLNGGLFECLDFLHPTEKGPSGGAKKCYEDGFSDHKDNPLVVPDFLFFAPEHKANLSETWGIASKKNEPVQGLIHILNRYNFTIVENSPIEQEVALDPELLGKVFENLLASYNPETQTTARKQTGSFYTPRPIVDYMVDESLKAYLLKPLTEAAGMSKEDAKVGLDLLFSYEEKEMDTVFEPEQVDVLIRAIDQCKILDPACGSGAFPMGILQKLVFVLGKLDKDNLKWEERQKSGLKLITDVKERRQREFEIASDFRDNADDYGRKLYLIENCLYGVDIQSIATQVSKLRFFISLVVDQNIDHDHADGNFGVRPLPNLETKFVAADTLIAIDKPGGQKELTELTEVKKLQDELQDIRHKIFAVKTTATKQKYKADDKAKREEIATALNSNGWPDDTADRLARWDPYKQNDSADFFDPEWMFGLKGFDVVIGNPPYVFGGNSGISTEAKKLYKERYIAGVGKVNLFTIFIERGGQLLQSEGSLCYILPNTLLRVTSYKAIRQLMLSQMKLEQILDLDVGVFDAVTASTIVIKICNTRPGQSHQTAIKHGLLDANEKLINQNLWLEAGGVIDIFSSEIDRQILGEIENDSVPLGSLCRLIRFGVVISGNFNEVVGARQEAEEWKPFLEGDEIDTYGINYQGRYLKYSKGLLHRSRTPDVFECRKIMIQRITGGHRPLKGVLDTQEYYNKESILNLIPKDEYAKQIFAIIAVINSSIGNWFYKKRFTNASKLTVNLSKEYVGQIPINTNLLSASSVFERLVLLIQPAKEILGSDGFKLLESLIDACVMECYFREHMAERNLLFHETVAEAVKDYNPDASETEQVSYLETVHQRLIAAKIPERLARIPEASPDLLAVILNEGKV